MPSRAPNTAAPKKGLKKEKKAAGPLTAHYTINLHKRLYTVGWKKHARRAIREVKKFAQRTMKTGDVRIDPSLNKYLWSRGIRHVPNRVRVQLARQNAPGEAGKLYTVVTHVPTETLKGLKTIVIKDN